MPPKVCLRPFWVLGRWRGRPGPLFTPQLGAPKQRAIRGKRTRGRPWRRQACGHKDSSLCTLKGLLPREEGSGCRTPGELVGAGLGGRMKVRTHPHVGVQLRPRSPAAPRGSSEGPRGTSQHCPQDERPSVLSTVPAHYRGLGSMPPQHGCNPTGVVIENASGRPRPRGANLPQPRTAALEALK